MTSKTIYAFKKSCAKYVEYELAGLQSKPTIYFLFYEFQQYLLKFKKKHCQEIRIKQILSIQFLFR